jgi:hypothetical protein
MRRAANNRRGKPEKVIEPMKPKVAEPTPETEADDKQMQIVDYISRAFPHCVCPRCKSGDPRIYKTRQYSGRATLRYHACYCGIKLKSMESW